MIFSTIEDEARLSGHRITNIFSQSIKSIRETLQSTNKVDFDTKFNASLTQDTYALTNYKNALISGMSPQQAFANTMKEASLSAQQYALTTDIANFSVDAFTVKQKQAEISLLAQGKSLSNIKTLLNEYNSSLGVAANGVTNCGLKQTEFISAVGQSNSVLGKYLSNLNGAKGNIAGYVGSLIAAKVATVGLRIATTALNAVMGVGIGLIAQFIISGIATIFEGIASSFKSAKEKMSEINAQFDEISSKAKETAKNFQQLKTSISDIAPRFAELSKGVDEFGNKVTLTDKEYTEFLNLNNQIAEMFPELNMGFDSNGNAMLALTGSADTLEQSLMNLVETQRQLANEEIAKQIPDQVEALKNYQKISDDTLKDYKDRLDHFKEVKDEFNEFYYNDEIVENAKKNYGDDWYTELQKNADNSSFAIDAQFIWGTSEEDKEKWRAMIEKYVSEDGHIIDWNSLLNSDDFKNQMIGLEKYVNDFHNKTKEKWKSLASYMNSWVQTDETFNGLDDQMQKIISNMISNLDYGSENLNEAEEIKLYIKDNILLPLSQAEPEIKDLFSQLFTIDKNDNSTAEYIREIEDKARKIANNSDFTYDEVLRNTGYEKIISNYKENAEDIVKSLDGVTTDMVYALSPDDVTRAFDYIKNYGISSWDELINALENNTFETVMDFTVESEGMDNLFSAMKESVTSTGLTSDSIAKLKARYQELENYDAARLFEKTANGIHLNTKELRELESAYEKQQKKAIDNKLDGLIEQYNDLTKQINSTSDAVSTADLYAKRNDILDQINDTAELASMYDGLTSAFYKWEQAQSIGEEGDMYDSLAGGLEHIKELYDEGLVGTNKFRTAVQLMSNQDLSTASVDELLAAYESGYSVMTKYFTDGREGCLNFLNDVQKLNSEWVHMNEDGSWDINFGVGGDQDVANALGINVESVQAIMRKLSDYGFDINLDSIFSQLDNLQSRAEEANQALIDIGATDITFNFGTDDIDYLNEQIEQSKDLLNSLYNDDGELNVKYNEEDVENAISVIERLIYRKQSLDDAAILKVDTSTADSDITNIISKLQEFKSSYNNLEVQTAIGADTTEAQTACDGLLTEISGMNAEILATLGIDTTSLDTLNSTINTITPEIMVKAGLDASLIEGYQASEHNAEGTVIWNNNIDKVTSWINQSHTASGTVNWGNNTNNVKTYFTASGTVNWRNSGKAQGTAYVNGNWGTKDSGVALGGEVGQELVVRNGKFFTIGEDSAEFFAYKKNDIIFNAEQTRQILKNGKITNGKKRGITYATGTAFSSGTGTIHGSGSLITRPTGGNSSGGSSSSNNSSSTKEDKIEVFDWIEITIERIERVINKLKRTAESTYKALKTKLGATADEISKVNQEIELQQQAYNRYIQQANSVGLSSGLAEKVRNGTIDINQYDEDTRDLISDYQKWFEAALDCADAIDDLHESLASLYEDNFNNIKDDYENQLSLYEHLINTYETGIDLIETKGYLASTKYYAAMQDIEKQTISIRKKELADLETQFANAINSGEIEKYSQAWYEMQNAINECKEEIADSEVNLAEFSKTMREIEWEHFDYIQERIKQITKESDFLIDLLSSKELYNEKGQLNDDGMATMGLHGQNYNVYMAQADQYAQELLDINKEIAKDPYNTELISRREELLGLQQDSILAAENEKEAIKDMVEEGINRELDSLKELIDAYNDTLDSAKSLYDYQNKISDKADEVAKLQKQLSAYAGDDSEETKTIIQKLEIDLAKAQEDLAETEYEQYISEQKKLLDELYVEYEEILNQRLDNIDALIGDMIDQINLNADTINSTLTETANSVGYTISDNMQKIWDGSTNALDGTISKYGNEFSLQLTAVNNVLNSIASIVAGMIDNSNDEAQNTVDSTSPTTDSSNTNGTSTPPISNPNQEQTVITAGKKINAQGAKIYDYAGDTSGEKQYFSDDPIYTVLREQNGWLQVRYHKLSSGITGWFKKSDVKAYKTGGLVDYTGLAKVDGTPRKPELMLNSEDTANFLELRDVLRNISMKPLIIGKAFNNDMAKNIENIIPQITGLIDTNKLVSQIKDIPSMTQTNNISFGDIKIDHVEDYNDFVTQLQQDPQFEKIVKAMTVDMLAGKSSLSKYKYHWK